MKVEDLRIGQKVYHRKVYEHREPLTIVGIKETEVELEGDFSGGTYPVKSRAWLPLQGLSRIYNYAYKKRCRDEAKTIEELAKPIPSHPESNEAKTMLDLLYMVFQLTQEVEYNHEIN